MAVGITLTGTKRNRRLLRNVSKLTTKTKTKTKTISGAWRNPSTAYLLLTFELMNS